MASKNADRRSYRRQSNCNWLDNIVNRSLIKTSIKIKCYYYEHQNTSLQSYQLAP